MLICSHISSCRFYFDYFLIDKSYLIFKFISRIGSYLTYGFIQPGFVNRNGGNHNIVKECEKDKTSTTGLVE